jgi:membrane-bound lytic murein transglycosylase F
MFRGVLVWLLMLLLPVSYAYAGSHKHVKHKHWTNKYDRHFKKNTKHYFGPGFDWHWFKAQGIAESGLKPKAKSGKGAVGIMQIMPSTYKEILTKNPHLGNIEEPRWNIAAAIYYNRQLYKRWKKRDISPEERLDFTFASYNAGFTRVLRAIKKAKQKHNKQPEAVKKWETVSPFSPPETRNYIRRIDKLMTTK